MDNGPLVIEEIEAAEQLLREFDEYAPIKVAFWMRTTDEEQRYLYIASDRIGAEGVSDAYGEVVRIGLKIQSPYFNVFRVKVIDSATPLARAALEARDRFPPHMPARLGGSWFGGVAAADVYVYPALDHAKAP